MKKAELELNNVKMVKGVKMVKVLLNEDGYSSSWGELQELGLITISSNDTMRGISGLSSKPKWTGEWTGLCWTNSSILLSEEGLKILKKSSIKDWELN